MMQTLRPCLGLHHGDTSAKLNFSALSNTSGLIWLRSGQAMEFGVEQVGEEKRHTQTTRSSPVNVNITVERFSSGSAGTGFCECIGKS